ncbi:TetR/AcrR family transcriptional regulator [Streptomyces violascens]|uniref:TetR/AcrR family transcriptional regulator n=1 Tax=Streptomyces violascens TaxID=67381 RepID=UPI003648A2BF
MREAPGSAAPESTAPESASPEVAAPGSTAADSTATGSAAPEPSVPEAPVPDSAAGERRRDAGATRRRLLDAARDLFAERGYEGATVREIAERAGANQALLFRYFGSKQGLLTEVVAQGGLEQLRATPPEELFETALRSMLTSSASGSADRSLEVYLRSIGRGDEATGTLRELGEQYQSALAALSGARDGALRADLAMAWLLGIGLMRTVVAREPLASADPDTVCRMVVDTLDHLWSTPDSETP